jgi:hypothetical protein
MNTLKEQYNKLGFSTLADEIFELLWIAQIVEPTSKLGVSHIDKKKLYHCLAKTSTRNYRQQISHACYDRIKKQVISLLLYDFTILLFQVDEADEDRKPGLSKDRRL